MFGGLRLAPSVRIALERRCAGACESCGLAWPWALYVFRVDQDGPSNLLNLRVLCGTCSFRCDAAFTPLVGKRGTRERVLFANNKRAGVEPLTASRRRSLIAARHGVCERCGASGDQRQLQVHHKLAVLQGGHDGEENLQVLCFACHHHLRPCRTGCGAWTRGSNGICRNCLTRHRLQELLPDASWEEVKARFPGFVNQWKPGYEPQPLNRPGSAI